MTSDELLQVGPWLLDAHEGEVVVLTHLDAHPGGLYRRLGDLADRPSQPVVLDDAPDPFPVRYRRVDLPPRFVFDAHVEKRDGPAPSFPTFADLRVRDRGRDIAEQEPRLPGAEV